MTMCNVSTHRRQLGTDRTSAPIWSGGRFPLARLSIAAVATVVLLTGEIAHAQTYTVNTLVTFDDGGGTNGYEPNSRPTLDSNGNLFGTTTYGGLDNDGTVYEIAANTGTFTTLTAFDGTGTGSNPMSDLTLDGHGDLFGTTENGGANSDGTVFEIPNIGTTTNPVYGSTVETLVTFNGSGNGANPVGGLVLDSSGNIYGTTDGGGADSDGSVFKIAAGTNNLTTLATFDGSGNGSIPVGDLTIGSSGNLYGTTFQGGANNEGTVFRIAAGTSNLTTLTSFGDSGEVWPHGDVVMDSSGDLFGTSEVGGADNDGTIFEIAAGTGAVTTVATFDGSNGEHPGGDLTIDNNGNIYGTTEVGGPSNFLGIVYRFSSSVGTLTTLATFSGAGSSGDGEYPENGVTLDNNGNLYGVTQGGGPGSGGTVFELTPIGTASAPEPTALALLLCLAVPFALSIRCSKQVTNSRQFIE